VVNDERASVMSSSVASNVAVRTVRSIRHAIWVGADRTIGWATAPAGRSTRLRRVALVVWIALYAVMSVTDFLRNGAPTWWVVIVPTLVAAGAAAAIWLGGWHPRATVTAEQVGAHRLRAHLSTGSPPQMAGLPDSVSRHRVASAIAPRHLRRTQRAEVAVLVSEVNSFVAAAHGVGLVIFDDSDASVRAVPGAEQAFDDLTAVVTHRVRCIEVLTQAAIASSLDERAAVAGHLDQVAVSARLAAQRQVDGEPADQSDPSATSGRRTH